MLGWSPSDDRRGKYERFWFFDGNIFYSNHEFWKHTRSHSEETDPQEIIWEGFWFWEVLRDGHMHQPRAELINTRRITDLNFNNFSIQIRVKISHKSKFIWKLPIKRRFPIKQA